MEYQLWVGTFTEGQPRDGVFALGFDGRSLRVLQSWGGLNSPAYLQPVDDRVFAVEEFSEGGAIVELALGHDGFRRYPIPGYGFCHITPLGRFLYASGYAGGCLAGFDLESRQVCWQMEHQGKGPNPLRQERAHIHSSQPTPDGKGLFVADLGLDKLFQYRVGEDGSLTPHPTQPWVQTGPGRGPRHFAYHPDRERVYLVTEMGQTLAVYRYRGSDSTLEYLSEYPLYTGVPDPEDTAADVHVSPDGRFVYASVRGTGSPAGDKIYAYRITEDPARLEPAGSFPCGGQWPRSFHISPDGRYMAVANQKSGNVCLYPIDKETGALLDPVAEMAVPGAVCVKWEGLPAADLHTHSTASDGQYTPEALVALAKEHGLGVLALTDHDTFAGTDEAVAAGERLGVRVIRGIEIGTREHKNLHILGYGFSPEAPALRELCAKLKAGRQERKHRIIGFLREKGVELDLAEVEQLAGNDNLGRPHFAQVMLRHGYVQTMRQAFDQYLDTEEYQRIAPWKPEAREAVEAIRAAGGKVSMAHPYQLGLPDGQLEELVARLKGYGLNAIECYYPKHTAQQQAFYLSLAEKYGLAVSGGSDFHGEAVKPDVRLARLELDLDWLE